MWYPSSPVTEKRFLSQRRSVLFGYPIYEALFEDAIETFHVVSASLSDPERVALLSSERPMMAARVRATDSVNFLHVQYAAGQSVAELVSYLEPVISHWEHYAVFHERYHSNDAGGRLLAHMTLGDDDYWHAIRLTSWSILLGRSSELPRLCRLWDYANQPLDGLLERMVAPFVPGRSNPPDECTRHLPYFKLLKVFSAAPEDRPVLMAQYMDDWYEASRREPYYRSHTKGRDHNFLGYWSFEAAAVSVLLDIDDSSYRDHEFYPKDMADFGRAHRQDPVADAGDASGGIRLRCEAGQPCPREGEWETPAQANSRRNFKQGEVMPSVGGDYGQTIWQWVGESDV